MRWTARGLGQQYPQVAVAVAALATVAALHTHVELVDSHVVHPLVVAPNPKSQILESETRKY